MRSTKKMRKICFVPFADKDEDRPAREHIVDGEVWQRLFDEC